MTAIDWSKAPDGANQYQPPATENNRPVFWRVESGVAREAWAMNRDGSVRDHFLYGENGCQAYDPLRSIVRPSVWDGQGLPPVGVECELRKKTGGWGPAVIKYMSETQCVWLWQHGNPDQREWACEPSQMEFRPLRTLEQIAADERAAAIKEMWSTYWKPEVQTAFEGLGLLYDAGYRKQATS